MPLLFVSLMICSFVLNALSCMFVLVCMFVLQLSNDIISFINILGYCYTHTHTLNLAT